MTKKMIFEDPNVVVDRGDNEPAMLVDVDGYTLKRPAPIGLNWQLIIW